MVPIGERLAGTAGGATGTPSETGAIGRFAVSVKIKVSVTLRPGGSASVRFGDLQVLLPTPRLSRIASVWRLATSVPIGWRAGDAARGEPDGGAAG